MATNHAEYYVMASGGIALAGGFAEQKHFPSNGVRIIAATLALTLLASAANNSALEPLVRAFGMLLLLATVFAYVPGFQKHLVKKGKG